MPFAVLFLGAQIFLLSPLPSANHQSLVSLSQSRNRGQN